jgi:hypothetical protein
LRLKLAAVIETVLLLLQAIETNPVVQVPENNSNVGTALPNLLFPLLIPPNDIVCVVLSATNLYQTSSSAFPPQELLGAMPDKVAFANVPDVAVQAVFEVSKIAPEQSSFEGAAAYINTGQYTKQMNSRDMRIAFEYMAFLGWILGTKL